MKYKQIVLLLIIAIGLASCAGPKKAPATAEKAKPVIKITQTQDMDFEAAARAKASNGKAVQESQAAKAEEAKQQAAAKEREQARAKKAAADKAAAEKIAQEEEANRKAAAEKAQQEAAAASERQAEQQRLAQQKQAELLKQQQQQAAQEEAAKAAAAAKAAQLKQEQEAKEEKIRLAQEQARQDAEAKAAAEKAKAQAAEEKAAAAEKAKREAAKAAAVPAVASAAATGENAYYMPNYAGAKLDSPEFTPMGAERKANKDGSIPAWTGTMLGLPAGLKWQGDGTPYPDPYARDKRLFVISADNYQKYAPYLSEGIKMLFKKYPDTFYMPIYPSHRDGRFRKVIEDRTAWNLTHTKLVNGVDGLEQFTGGAPFPMPKNGAQALWNGRIIHPHPTLNGTFDDVAVYLNGNRQLRRQQYQAEFPFSYPSNPVGKVNSDISVNAGLVLVTVEKPSRQQGQMTLILEALDQLKDKRKAWVYIPGSRRVRRAPTVGYDTPDGPGGLVTVDDSLGFNGAMDRYDWKLLGKKEMYIPYDNYKFDTPGVAYEDLLSSGHANPEYMRYEKHRVWVVEATLKPGARHVYAKRRFYIDEDSWQIVLLDSYDGRGDLWRVGILNTMYAYGVQGYVARAQMFHDLQSGGYIAMRLDNQTAPPRYSDTPKGEDFYTPGQLRSTGR